MTYNEEKAYRRAKSYALHQRQIERKYVHSGETGDRCTKPALHESLKKMNMQLGELKEKLTRFEAKSSRVDQSRKSNFQRDLPLEEKRYAYRKHDNKCFKEDTQIEGQELGRVHMKTSSHECQEKRQSPLSSSLELQEEKHGDNLYHFRCKVHDELIHGVIDERGPSNVVSSLLVKELNLPTINHPSPYTIQWLKECGAVKVTKQVLVTFRMSSYVDTVLCDLVPIHSAHLLLGNPWHCDRRGVYKASKNGYYIRKDGKPIGLSLLTLEQVNQVFKKKNSEVEKSEQKNCMRENTCEHEKSFERMSEKDQTESCKKERKESQERKDDIEKGEFERKDDEKLCEKKITREKK